MPQAPKPSSPETPLPKPAASGPAEPPSRRSKRADRTFSATTGELREIVTLVDMARRLIEAELDVELRKPVGKRIHDADMDRMQARVDLLSRVAQEMVAIR